MLQEVAVVAPTDSTVLIQGETGTGKELIARAIHDQSPRRNCAFVATNCASIPPGLLESELFGHEKGAFTGAISRNIGRFELANQGTLFFDEIGDMQFDLQSKLLRVLQEQEFERLGSTRTIQANFRLVVATNKNLLEMVEDQEFRDDLYYRLSVFPIEVPPLRDRPEDIPGLTWHFIRKYAGRLNKQIDTILSEDMEALCTHKWPGNVRELQNVIERAVILSAGSILDHPRILSKRSSGGPEPEEKTLAANERRLILQALREADWVIAGPFGAASRLGVKRTTLLDKMRRLGIFRPKN